MGFITPLAAKQHPLQEKAERFSAIYSAYLSQPSYNCGYRETHITILARSALSPSCRALCDRLPELEARGVTVQMIFASLGPAEALNAVFRAVQRLNGQGAVPASMRCAHNPSLLDAHEQMTLGVRTVWTGDCMRRSSDNRNALDLFEENSIGSVRLADLAFSAMWMACRPLPVEVLPDMEAKCSPLADLDAITIAEKLAGGGNVVSQPKLRAIG